MKHEQKLREYVENLPAVDAHEHFRLEEVRLGKHPDAIWLFHQYAASDLLSAGMSRELLDAVMDTSRSLEKRWKMFKPFFDKIRFTGYSMAVLIAIRDLYGFETLDDSNYKDVSEKIQAENKPGLISRFVHEKGNITDIVNCNYQIEQPTARTHGIMRIKHLARLESADQARQIGEACQISIEDLESYIAALDSTLAQYQAKGIVGLKMTSFEWKRPNRIDADKAFDGLLKGRGPSPEERTTLDNYLYQKLLELVPKYDFTVPVHCGYLSGVNCDFTLSRVKHMLPLLQDHPDVRFDLFHLSYPWIDEAIAFAKAFTNVSLNLTWAAIISPCATERAMGEIVNTVPVNKILGMGGDYWELPDVAYGHLRIARRALARGLSRCVAEEKIGFDDAMYIARLWLHDNAYEIYPRMNAQL